VGPALHQTPFSAFLNGVPDGQGRATARSAYYLHGLFYEMTRSERVFCNSWRGNALGVGGGLAAGPTSYSQNRRRTLDALADHMETHLDVSGCCECRARLP